MGGTGGSSPLAATLIPTVSAVVGEGTDAHRLARVGAWTLTVQPDDDEPRIRDLDLAERLGYERPRDIRKLIKELHVAGKLNDLAHRDVQERWAGQVAARPVREFRLTEAQALKVVAKSETPKADAILDEVIRVYMLVRRHLVAEQNAPLRQTVDQQNALLVAQRQDLEQLRAENRLLREQQTNGTIPGLAADWIREQIALIAPMFVDLGWCPRKQSINAARRVLQNGVARAAQWGHLKGHGFQDMPTTGFPHARAYLKAEREAAERELGRRRREREAATVRKQEQLGLFGGSAADKPN